MEHNGWSFLCGWAPLQNFLFCARERDDIANKGLTVSTFYMWNGTRTQEGHWSTYSMVADWRPQGMAFVRERGNVQLLVAVGANGQYYELQNETARQYLGSIAIADLIIRRARPIQESVFAVGMGRQVLKRIGRDNWIEFGPGTTAADQGRVVGLEGIDGRSEDDFYVVGWHGEIWRWHGEGWHRIDSPTNVNLNAVACSRDADLIYAVGDNGCMLRGVNGIWEMIDTGRPENLQDVAIFKGEVFVVTDFGLLRLEDTGLVPDQRFADDDRPRTCLHLLPARDGVISMGPKDLFSFSNGTWRRVI